MNRTSTRVVLNRQRLDRVHLALADGLFAVAETIVHTARPPSDVSTESAAEAFEEASEKRPDLAHAGGAAVWVDGKKVAGMGLDGKQPQKPRGLKLLRPGITGIAGFGFPGRFAEFGTIHQPPRPFLTPAVQQVIPSAPSIMGGVVRTALARIP